jgi:hypothetical protein
MNRRRKLPIEQKEKIKKEGHMSRMINLSNPKSLIVIGLVLSVALGAVMPFLGIYIGKMLFVL